MVFVIKSQWIVSLFSGEVIFLDGATIPGPSVFVEFVVQGSVDSKCVAFYYSIVAKPVWMLFLFVLSNNQFRYAISLKPDRADDGWHRVSSDVDLTQDQDLTVAALKQPNAPAGKGIFMMDDFRVRARPQNL